MSIILKNVIKELNGDKVTILDKIQTWWYELWQYTWGFRHLRDWKYKLKHLLWDRYDLIRTKLPKTGYHDSPVIILYGMMNIVVEFVEVEKCFENIDFSNGTEWEEAGETIQEVYDWWKDYNNRQKEIEIALDNWHETAFSDRRGKGWLEHLNTKKDTPETKRYSELHDYLTAKLQEEETEMLIKIVKIKDFLWT